MARSQSIVGEDGFEGDVRYSFVSVNAGGASFEMHGLVQLATRTWLQIHNEVEQWQPCLGSDEFQVRRKSSGACYTVEEITRVSWT